MNIFRFSRRALSLLMGVMLLVSLIAAPAAAAAYEAVLSGTLGGSGLQARVYMDMEQPAVKAVISGRINGTDVTAEITLTESALTFTADPLLTEAVGIDLTKFAANLPGSVFAPDSGTAYAMDQDSYDSLMNSLQGVSAGSAAVQQQNAADDLTEQLSAVMEVYANLITEKIADGMSYSREEQTVNISDEAVDGIYTLISVRYDSLAAALRACAEQAKQDQDLEVLAARILASADTAALEAQGLSSDPAALIAQAAEALENLAQVIENGKTDLTIDYVEDRLTGLPAAFDIALDDGSSSTGIEFVNTSAYKYMYLYTETGDDYQVLAGYSVTVWAEDDGSETDMVYLIYDNEAILAVTLNYDIPTGTYSLNTWTSDGSTFSMLGRFGAEEDGTVYLTAECINDELCDVSLRFGACESESVGGTFRELLTMSEAEVDGVFAALAPLFA